jgi:hypothetical protein
MILTMLAPMLFLLAAQSSIPLDTNIIRLATIKQRMAENLRGLPNYTCTQTVERSQRSGKSKRFRLIDTIRLEVALVDGKELFAWPGASKFEDKELREMVGGGGAIGNGNFALHAKSVFLSSAPRFVFAGEGEMNGRPTLRYTYQVPRFLSGFQLRVGEARGVSGYRGEFEADAQSLDVLRLEVHAEEIPTNVPLAGASDKLWYARTKIGESDYLLPQSSELTMTVLDGTENRNHIQFANCHQFGIESTISFADPPPAAEAPPPTVSVDLPDGLLVEAALNRGIPFDKVAIGDIIEGKVTSGAKYGKKMVVPKGATVRGRILKVEKIYQRTEMRVLTLELFEIEFPGAHAEIHAVPSDITPLAGLGSRTAVDKQGIIYISGNRQELIQGTRIVWRIETKQGRQSQ